MSAMYRKRTFPYQDDSMDRDRDMNLEERLLEMFQKIGTGKNLFQDVSEEIEEFVNAVFDDSYNNRDTVIQFYLTCIRIMPERISIVATIVGLTNAKDFAFGNELVDSFVRCFKECLRSSQFDHALFCMRFLCDLINCHVITAASILQIYENFVEVTLEDRIPQVRSDWYVYAVLSTLPWVGKEVSTLDADRLRDILTTTKSYLEKRTLDHLNGLRVWDSDEPHPQEDYLNSLVAQIENLQKQGWNEKVIWRPYQAFYDALHDSKAHKISQIILPSHDDECVYPMPRVIFRMFDFTDVDMEASESMKFPGAHAIERFLIEDAYSCIINSLALDRKKCSKMLVEYPFQVKLPKAYMITEVVLGKLFELPTSREILLFYGVLFLELCRELPDVMPQILAQSVEMLFDRLNHMKPACIERFVDWFSYHLSNYKFQWSWADWLPVAKENPNNPKPRFIAESLQRLLRFSYYDYIKKIIPTGFASLLPKPPGPINKYDKQSDEDYFGHQVCWELMDSLKSRCTPNEALSLVKRLPSDLADMKQEKHGMAPGVSNLQIDVFFTALFNVGSKTFTHAFALLNKYAALIHTLLNSMETQVEVLHVLFSVWKEQQQMMVVLIERMLTCQLIESEAVVRWIYSDEMSPHLLDFFLWEVLHKSLHRVGSEVENVTKTLDEAKASLKSLEREDDESGDLSSVHTTQLATTKENIENLKEQRSASLRIQLAVFSLALHRHIRGLEQLSRDADRVDVKIRIWWLEGRMRQLLMQHHNQLKKYTENLHAAVFSKHEDPVLEMIFREFCSLRS